MERVAVYCRVSTEEQRERQSIENQIEQAKDYCQRQGYIINDFYSDNGVSGTIPFEERDSGKRLLQDANEGKFKLVLIWKIDRLARDTRLSLTIAHTLTDLGINIKSMTEPFDTSTAIGEFMFTQLASFAKLERDNIRERSIAGTNRLARQGKWLGGIVPYGYRVENGYLVVNENPLPNIEISEAEVVRMIYNWIGETGLSTIEVARKLNAINIPTHYSKDGREFHLPPQNHKGGKSYYDLNGKRKVKTSGLWHPHRIGNLVHNSTYMGVHRYGLRCKKPREIIQREVSPIVSTALWYKAQEVLRNNFLWATRNSRRQYLLRGLIKCGLCGRSLTGHYYEGRKKAGISWYVCNGKSLHVRIATGKEACLCKSVKGEWIENLVWEELKSWILSPKSLELALSEKLREHEKEKGTWFGKLAGLKIGISQKEEEKAKIVDLYRKDIIEMSDVELQLKQIAKEKDELERMANELKSKLIGDFSTKEIIREIRVRLSEFRNTVKNNLITWEEKRKIAEMFVREVRINMTKENKTTLLIDTIPFREYVESLASEEPLARDTVYTRNSSHNEPILKDDTRNNTVEVVYLFPMPNKEISSIVDHTGRDSWPLPA